MRKIPFKVTIIVLGLIALGACKDNKKPKQNNQPAYSNTPGNYPTYGQGGMITITVSGSTGGSALYVALNQSKTWGFSATSSDGQMATITKIEGKSNATGMVPQGMQISGNQVTFMPSNTNDLNGKIDVYANAPGQSETYQSFYWTQDPTGSSTNCTQQLMTSAVSAFMQKQFDLSSIPALFQACAQQILGLFNK